ncbi:MAG: hypothetical protein ACXVSE_14435, partial [Solirubrobacteraceae bacterium]
IRLGDLATEELDRERGHAPEKVARGLVVGSAAIAARNRRTFVLLDGDVMPWCPRDGALREERGLLRQSSPRLGPWRDDVQE